MNPVTPVLEQLDAIIENVEQSLGITETDQTNATGGKLEATPKEPAEAGGTTTATEAVEASSSTEEKPVQKKKKEKKKKGPKPAAASTVPPEQSQFLQCDLRVGQIKTVSSHPEASGLYVLTVSYAGDDERTVCAGLKNFLKEDELQDRKVVTICNLKPRKLRGVDSQAMILAGSVVSGEDEEKEKETVVPLNPPKDINVGDIISVEGMNGLERTVEDGKFVSGKNWDRVVGRLGVKDGKACYDGKPLIVGDSAVLCDLPDGSEIH